MNSQADARNLQNPRFSPFSQREELDVFALLKTVWRGRWWVMFCMAVCFVVGGYYAYRIAQPTFSATAVIEFAPEQSQLLGLEAIVSGTSVDSASLKTELAAILSREMAEDVVKKLELAKLPQFYETPPPDWKEQLKTLLGLPTPPLNLTEEGKQRAAVRRAIAWVRNSVTATSIRDTYLLRITANTDRPTTATQLANALSDSYIASQLEEKYIETEQAIGWLSDRVRDLEIDLGERETQINDLESETDLVNRQALQSVQLQAKDFRDRIEDRKATLETLRTQIEQQDGVMGSDSKAEILSAFDDPFLNRFDRQLGDNLEGDASILNAFRERMATLAEGTRIAADRAEDEIASLTISLESLEIEISEQNVDLRKLEQMQRELAVAQNLYETFLTGLQEATVQVGIVRPDSRIMSTAVLPQMATSPQKPRILAISLFIGFILGLTFLLLRDFMNNRIQDMNELENLTKLPVLGSIPIFPIRKRRDLIKFLTTKTTSPGSESVRNLRTSLLMQDIGHAPQLIVVTSSIPGEGKTSLSLSLAHNLSGLGKRVLLVEGDIRLRTLNAYIDVPDETPGLLDVVTGTANLDDAVVHEPATGVDFLVGQVSNINPADLFSTSAFKNILEVLKTRYDHILIDTPPVLVVPDARILSAMADSTLYVVKWDSTTREQILSGVKLLENANHGISGLAISQVNTRKMRNYGYGDQYGAYSSYGNAYYNK